MTEMTTLPHALAETDEQRLVRDVAETVRRHIGRAETDARQCQAALTKIRDEAIENGVCRWCRETSHIYSCPAGVADSYLIWCGKRDADAATDYRNAAVKLRESIGVMAPMICKLFEEMVESEVDKKGALATLDRLNKAMAATRWIVDGEEFRP